MTQLELKSHFHKLIDEINDQKQLSKLYDFMLVLKLNYEKNDEDWWDELTEEQKRNLDISIEQCNDPSKLIPHEQVMRESRKWLKNNTTN